MYSVKLNIEDSVFEKIIYFLQNLPKNEVQIIEKKQINMKIADDDTLDIQAFSNHSANTIPEWKDKKEDDVWR
jgi:hypothetical protein